MSAQAPPRLRRPRLTFRLRLAATYAVLLVVAGALMLGVVYYVVGVLAVYDVSPAVDVAGHAAPVQPESTGSAPQVEATPLNMPGVTPADTDGWAPAAPALLIGDRSDLQGLILTVATVLLVVLAAVGAFVGWLIAGRMLRPLHEVSVAARQAATGRLDHRIGLGSPRDEITELAATFDGMLDSLESSFHAHQRFAANASHELRTPLATTRAMLDVALMSADGTQRDVLLGLRAMNERSIGTVSSLLDLAEVEAAPVGERTEVELADVAASSAADVAAEADRRSVVVELKAVPAAVRSDAALVRVLVDNLVGNAVRYNVPGGRVLVRTAADGEPRLVVENTGRRLSAAEASAIREPFFRLEGRSAATDERGRGLGLAIVEAVARRIGASVDLTPRDGGGLVATVVFAART